ncbi:MAG: hypothetical protein K2J85_06615 [Anaeroplasmataceae bacterium]|nr:hypothetical protein [Anaeroplasmataceae bacterium]
MKKYEKPILEEEKIQIEDIVAVSADVDVPGTSLPVTDSNAIRWGK